MPTPTNAPSATTARRARLIHRACPAALPIVIADADDYAHNVDRWGCETSLVDAHDDVAYWEARDGFTSDHVQNITGCHRPRTGLVLADVWFSRVRAHIGRPVESGHGTVAMLPVVAVVVMLAALVGSWLVQCATTLAPIPRPNVTTACTVVLTDVDHETPTERAEHAYLTGWDYNAAGPVVNGDTVGMLVHNGTVVGYADEEDAIVYRTPVDAATCPVYVDDHGRTPADYRVLYGTPVAR